MNEDVKFLQEKPFGVYKVAFGGIPTSYTEALTYEEQLLWFSKYISETITPTVNTNATILKDLKDKWEDISPRLDTLDSEVATLNSEMTKKAELVMLYSDGNAIYSDKEMTTEMTYVEVKTLLADSTKDVQLHNGNYNLRPEYTYTDSTGVSAIWFNGVTTLAGKPYIYRIIINSNNEVRNDEYALALESEITAINNILNGVTEAVTNQSEVTK